MELHFKKYIIKNYSLIKTLIDIYTYIKDYFNNCNFSFNFPNYYLNLDFLNNYLFIIR